MKIDLNKVLITGANGMVGSYVDFGIKAGRESFDITNMSQVVSFIEKLKPMAVLHLAAETNMEKCENDPSHAYLVNTVGTYNLATAAKLVGAKMIYVSTDAVFPSSNTSHTKKDKEQPKSIYGHSKYLGELAVIGLSDDYVIARTSWVFGGGKEKDNKFVGKFIAQLDNSEAKAVNDQFNSPTYAKDLVEALKKLISDNKSGTFHVANSGRASRYDVTEVMVKTLNKKIKILPVSASTYGLLPYQESSGGLIGDVGLRSWQEALVEYLENEW